MPTFLLGERGERPVTFVAETSQLAHMLSRSIPGTIAHQHEIHASWDAAPFVADALKQPLTKTVPPVQSLYPQLQPLGDLGPVLRGYQGVGALHMALRSGALCWDDMRLGKTLEALAAARLAGVRKTLVLGPAIARRGWARQVARFLHQPVLLLHGRATTMARATCPACLFEDPDCGLCHGAGLVAIRPASIREAVLSYAWTFANYDILQPQTDRSDAGVVSERQGFPGWGRALAQVEYDLVIADEIHRVRGFEMTSHGATGRTRREQTVTATNNARRVWGLTGTPIASFVRDLWSSLDLITKGAASGGYARTPFAFQANYCDGHRNPFGWVSSGFSARAELELAPRLKCYAIRRVRREVLSEMPTLDMEVVRLAPDPTLHAATQKALTGRGSFQQRIQRALLVTSDVKAAHVVPVVADAPHLKQVVFVYRKQTCQRVCSALRNAFKTDGVATRVFRATGDDSVEERDRMSVDFVDHRGGAVFVATIDSVPESISLRGASIVHFLDLHAEASKISQAAARPAEPGMRGVSILFYVVEGSSDDRFIKLLLPKIEAQHKVVGDDSLQEFAHRAAREADHSGLLDSLLKGLHEEQARNISAELTEIGVN